MYNKTEQNHHHEARLQKSARLALTLGLLGLIIAGCTYFSSEATPTIQVTDAFTSTLTAAAPETATPAETPVYITDNYFEIGRPDNPIKLTEPFTATIPLDTARDLNWGEVKQFHMDIPMLVTTASWNMSQTEVYNQNGLDNSEGNRFLVVQPDNPDHLLILSHSGNRSSVGKAVYMAGAIEAAGLESNIIGDTIDFNFNGIEAIGTIVDITNLPTEEFYASENWSDPQISPIMYAKLAELRIAQTTSETGVYYITFISCNYTVAGKPSAAEILAPLDAESATQTLMTVKFLLP